MFLVFVSNILFILCLCLVASPTFMVGVLSSHRFMLRRLLALRSVFTVFATMMAGFGNQTVVNLQSVRERALRHKSASPTRRALARRHHEWCFYCFCFHHLITTVRPLTIYKPFLGFTTRRPCRS